MHKNARKQPGSTNAFGMAGHTRQASSRVEKKRTETRVRLMRAAYDLMSVKGIDETTIQEITSLADLGFGTFYNYFSSKDDIASAVLDCVINALGRRNDLANSRAKVTDPVIVVANSVRLVAHEMLVDPMWRWWLKRTDLMVKRMRAVFRPYGMRDMKLAVDSGRYKIAGDDMETAWSFLIWLLAGAITDVVDGYRPLQTERLMGEAVLRVMGVDQISAQEAVSVKLPRLPKLAIDFAFVPDGDQLLT